MSIRKLKISSAYKRNNPNPRHLMVFLDGTWNDENGKENDGITTSIYRLFRAVRGRLDDSQVPHVIEGEEQVALYFRGIGNDDDNGMMGSYFEGAFGAGEKRIRDHAYCHIIKHYRKGDRLSIFGFSRGAACARMLAGNIEKHKGLFDSCIMHVRDSVNENTGKPEQVYVKYSDESKARHRISVDFLGVFDTVGAFGVPIDLGFSFQKVNLFKDMTISAAVKKVVHCLSIDDTREPFIPTLCNAEDKVDEVWFAGVHADIGGGYRHRELAAIPLEYMVRRLQETFAAKPVDFIKTRLDELTTYDMSQRFNLHYHGDGTKKDPRRIYVQAKDKETAKKPRVHRSVFRLMESDQVYLAEPMHSFAQLSRILYSPRGVGMLSESEVAVD